MYKYYGFILFFSGFAILVGDLVAGQNIDGTFMAKLTVLSRVQLSPLPGLLLPFWFPSVEWFNAFFGLLSWDYWWLDSGVGAIVRYVVLFPLSAVGALLILINVIPILVSFVRAVADWARVLGPVGWAVGGIGLGVSGLVYVVSEALR